jgi:hypothetical protein
MKRSELKELIISSLSKEESGSETARMLEEAGVDYSFKPDFRDKVLDRLFTAGYVVNREMEFVRSWNLAFYRIALTGVAAIVVLLISIYVMEGSFSFNSLLGISDNYDETIVCLLTGN